MDARKLLINLLYRATAQSSELPGWSHRETNAPGRQLYQFDPRRGGQSSRPALDDHRLQSFAYLLLCAFYCQTAPFT